MNALRFLGFLSLALFLTSCANLPKKNFGPAKCPNGAIYLGKIKLDRKSLKYFPYEEFNSRDSIYFINAEEEEIKFGRPRRVRTNRNFVKRIFDITCEDSSLNVCQSYNEGQSVFYECDELEINLSVSHLWKLQFIDKLELKMSGRRDRMSSYLKIITSSKNIQEIPDGKRKYHENYEFMNELDTLGKVFLDVFKTTNEWARVSEMYYNRELGVVAFNDTLSGFWIHDGID